MIHITCKHCKAVFHSPIIGDNNAALGEATQRFNKHLEIVHEKEVEELARNVIEISQRVPWIVMTLKHTTMLEEESVVGDDGILVDFIHLQVAEQLEKIDELLGVSEEEEEEEDEEIERNIIDTEEMPIRPDEDRFPEPETIQQNSNGIGLDKDIHPHGAD